MIDDVFTAVYLTGAVVSGIFLVLERLGYDPEDPQDDNNVGKTVEVLVPAWWEMGLGFVFWPAYVGYRIMRTYLVRRMK